MPAFGTVPLDRLRVSHVSRAFDLIEERNAEIAAARASDDPDVVASVRGKRGTGPATQQRIRATLRAALAPAARSGLLAGNVAAQLEMAAGDRPKARPWTQARVDDWRKRYDAATEGMHGDRARWRVWRLASMRPSPVMVWTLPQIGQFLDHIADDWLYALYHLISYRGLRRGEACGLRWADVDLDGGKVTITAAIVQLGWTATESTLKSDASDGTIGLDAETVKVLKAWRKVQLAERVRWGAVWTDTGHVFTAEQGGPLHPDRITDVFEWAAFKAGLPPIRLHDLRHGAASIAHAAGADIKAISHLLRHSSIGITADTYMSVFEEADRELAESMSRMVPRARAVGDSERTDAPTTRPHLRPRDSGGIGG
jgi:integrase